MESKSTFRSKSSGLVPNPSCVDQVDSGHMIHSCGWRDKATFPSHPGLCVLACV